MHHVFATRRPRQVRSALCLVGALAGLAAAHAAEAPVSVVVGVDRPGAAIPSTLYGVFFEDINFGADGGLYAELVKNTSFEFPDSLMGWSKPAPTVAGGSLEVRTEGALSPDNPAYLRMTATPPGCSLENEGFRGIGVRAGASYAWSAYLQSPSGEPAKLRVELVGPQGSPLATATVACAARSWRKVAATLRSGATEPKARLRLTLERGSLDLDCVSLFPKDTWKGRPNGLRADLVKMLADLRPGFVRFPGGCIVEGRHLATRYRWKSTLGEPASRRLLINRWNDEIKHRPTPDYFQTFGLGFFEYFLLCEDLGAEPLPILNCGMACQFNSNELVPVDQLDPYLEDALDLIEFANGPVTTPWGRRRAELGHPAPFQMKLLGVGNEQWGPQYVERYERFATVLKTRHPEVRLISSAGPGPDGERYQFLWGKLRALKADIIDEHCYAPPAWFLANATRYDGFDRQGPRIFMGEYAAQSVAVVSPQNRNNWECALAEAAFMTGLERNADLVVMSSYAPLFAHMDAWQWTPNLIWFDNLGVAGTPSYYVQQLFSRNRGTRVLPLLINGAAKNGAEQLYSCAARDEAHGETVVKLVNPTARPRAVRLELTGGRVPKQDARVCLLAHAEPQAENRLDAPRRVAPVESRLAVRGAAFDYQLPPYSVAALRLKCAPLP